jgi:hypothetical protein
VYRTVEEWRPTILIDEADSFLFDNEPMRNVLNSGHHIKGSVKTSVKIGDNWEPRIFSTFTAVAVGLVGELKGVFATLDDRSIRIVLKRRKPEEKIENLSGPRRRDEFKPLRQRLMRWAQDHRAAIAGAEPNIPDALYNRVADNWRPLFAIADAAGGEWPKKARAIALRVAPSEELTIVEMLIADIWEVFNATGSDRTGSKELVDRLAEMTDRPWPEFGKSGKPITQAKLAQILKRPGIGIHPEQARFGPDDSRKGYMRHQFDEAFSRLLPVKGSPDRNKETNADTTGTSEPFQTETLNPDVSVPKSEKSNNDGLCFGVSVWKGGIGQDGGESSLSTRWPGLSPRAVDQFAREVSGLKTGSAVGLEDAIRTRLAKSGVPVEALDVEVENVVRRIAAWGDVDDTLPTQAGRATEPAPYEVLGGGPPGERCVRCGKSGGVKRIRYRGCVDLWHPACLNRHLAALADPPVKVPEGPPDPLDEHGAPHPAPPPPANGVDPGLSPRTVDDIGAWFEQTRYDRRDEPEIDAWLDRELCRRLREDYGVLPEFISTEFERVMKVVFSDPDPKPRPDPHEERIAAGDAGGTVANPAHAGTAPKPGPHEDMGRAPVGSRCTLCDSGLGSVRRIRHGGRDNFLHLNCADRFLKKEQTG